MLTMPASDLVRWADEIDRAEAMFDLRAIEVETFIHMAGDSPGTTPPHIKEGNRKRAAKMDELHRRITRGTPAANQKPSRKYVPVGQFKDYLRSVHRLVT